jgi:hypothetical protein
VQSGQTGAPAQYWLFEAKTKHLVAGPANTRAELTSFPGVKSLAGMRVLTTPARRVVVTCSAETAVVCPGPPGYSNEVGTSYYLFDDEPTAARPSPALTGAQLGRTPHGRSPTRRSAPRSSSSSSRPRATGSSTG